MKPAAKLRSSKNHKLEHKPRFQRLQSGPGELISLIVEVIV